MLKLNSTLAACLTLAVIGGPFACSAASAADGKKPNIIVIMGDDIGMWNIGAYHRGLMVGRTPQLDKLAKEGMLFTDYYAAVSYTHLIRLELPKDKQFGDNSWSFSMVSSCVRTMPVAS